MRKFLTVVIAFVFVFSLSTAVFAIDGQPETGISSDGLGLKQELKDKKQEIRQDLIVKKDILKEKEASRVSEIKAKKLEMLKKRFAFLTRNVSAFLLRLDKISAKISSRITKLQARGVDTSKAQAKLDEAKILRDAAKTAIDKAIIDAQSVASSTDIRAAAEKAMVSLKDARTAIFNYHKKLVEAIRELKSSRELREGTGSAEED